jgi:DNA-binding transcriptional MerR regulator
MDMERVEHDAAPVLLKPVSEPVSGKKVRSKALTRTAASTGAGLNLESVSLLNSDLALATASGVVDLPVIPAKRYFTIGEVSELCGVKPYVLRYWEQEFAQLRPMKRRGNRRYYQHHEVLLVRRIRGLLYEQGFTISGARNQLHDVVAHDSAHEPVHAHALHDNSTNAESSMNLKALKQALETVAPEALQQLRESLLDIRSLLDMPADAEQPVIQLQASVGA